MIFPTLAFWSTPDPEDALGRIDRALNDRNHRLSAGLSISNRFDRVSGALVVAQGNGRYLRIRHVVDASTPISKSIRGGCLEFVTGQNRECGQLSQLLADLAETQSNVVEQLKCSAGKYVDRVLAVAVQDPGVWTKDFDGRVSYAPMCDATRLAELSGVTVIDAFPSRDIAVGGQGTRLEALPYWILFGDRNPKIARQARSLVVFGDQSRGYVLPASDGLDAEVPTIRAIETIGFRFLDQLILQCLPKNQKLAELDCLYADGRQIPDLRQRWENAIKNCQPSGVTNSKNASGQPLQPVDITHRLVNETQAYLAERTDAFSNVIRTGIRWVIDLVLEQLNSWCNEKPSQLFVACPAKYEASVINQLTQLMGGTTVLPTRQSGVDQDQLDPVVAAMLGLFHIDQMPANVPWLTGADCQRILGRITPGRPFNWRQLVRVMADFHPAPMKLKDAV